MSGGGGTVVPLHAPEMVLGLHVCLRGLFALVVHKSDSVRDAHIGYAAVSVTG